MPEARRRPWQEQCATACFESEIEPLIAFQRNRTDITQSAAGTAFTGTFDTDLWTLGARISKTWSLDVGTKLGDAIIFGPAFVRPSVSVSHVFASRESWLRSDGLRIAGSDQDQGSATFGVKTGFTILHDPGTVPFLQPTLGAKLVWNYATPGDQLFNAASRIETPEVFGSVEAGLTATLANGWRGKIHANYSGFGSDVHAASLWGGITIPLRATP